MSHFSVLVVTERPDQVDSVLQPYHEYECTGIKDQYVKWIDETDELQTKFDTETVPVIFLDGKFLCYKWNAKEHDLDVENLPANLETKDMPLKERYSSLEEMAINYCGYDEDQIRNGRIGRITNPNSKWDWWVIGGRWSNFLLKKDGTSVDQAYKSELDFETRKIEANKHATKEYDKAITIIAGRKYLTWPETREKFSSDIESARTFYNGQDVIKDLKKEFTDFMHDFDAYKIKRNDFIRAAELAANSTFALVLNGNWSSRGNMGWFGMVADEKDDWDEKFDETLAKIPDHMILTVVDCHI